MLDNGATDRRLLVYAIGKACKALGIPLWSPQDLRYRHVSDSPGLSVLPALTPSMSTLQEPRHLFVITNVTMPEGIVV